MGHMQQRTHRIAMEHALVTIDDYITCIFLGRIFFVCWNKNEDNAILYRVSINFYVITLSCLWTYLSIILPMTTLTNNFHDLPLSCTQALHILQVLLGDRRLLYGGDQWQRILVTTLQGRASLVTADDSKAIGGTNVSSSGVARYMWGDNFNACTS